MKRTLQRNKETSRKLRRRTRGGKGWIHIPGISSEENPAVIIESDATKQWLRNEAHEKDRKRKIDEKNAELNGTRSWYQLAKHFFKESGKSVKKRLLKASSVKKQNVDHDEFYAEEPNIRTIRKN